MVSLGNRICCGGIEKSCLVVFNRIQYHTFDEICKPLEEYPRIAAMDVRFYNLSHSLLLLALIIRLLQFDNTTCYQITSMIALVDCTSSSIGYMSLTYQLILN